VKRYAMAAGKHAWHRIQNGLTVVADQLALAELQNLQVRQLRYWAHRVITQLLAPVT
jgi:hypothetical protein